MAKSRATSGLTTATVITVVLVGVVLGGWLRLSVDKRVSWSITGLLGLRPPAVASEYRTLDDIWTPEEADALLRMVEDVGSIGNVVQDKTSAVEHIGEAMPVLPDGSCEHPYLVPNANGTLCILPSRLDIGRHYMITGGRKSLKEPYGSLVSRILGFSNYFFSMDDSLHHMPGVAKLFASRQYRDAVQDLCPGRPLLDPFQMAAIANVPGQQVATHYDVPWFYGASRFTLPQWLLVVMDRSGLWADRVVPQMQGVAYLHKWPKERTNNGGNFFFYPAGPYDRVEVFPAKRSAAILLDGSQMVHGTDPFLPDAPPPPPLSRASMNKLEFRGNNTWEITVDGRPVARYDGTNLRFSFVWRALCFESTEDREQYLAAQGELKLEEVLDKLVEELRRRGRLGEHEARPAPLDLALLLLDEFVNYPFGTSAAMPYNYCLASTFLPSWASWPLWLLC